jgi:signal transduction histidine kinase
VRRPTVGSVPRPLKPRDLVLDIGAAVFCLLLALALYAVTGGLLSVVTLIGMAAALALRRISPGGALALAWVTALVQVAGGGYPELADLAVLPVLFATSAYGARSVKWAGLVSTFLGAAVVTVYLGLWTALQEYESFGAVVTGRVPGTQSLLVETLALFAGCLVLFLLSWVLGLLARTYSTARASRRAQAAAETSRAEAERETVVEQERTRIARDMHDVVAHSLAVVIAQADGARYARASDDTAVESALLTIASTARSALGDVRVLLAQLRDDTPAGPQPGLADLEALFGQLQGSGLRLRVDRTGDAGLLPAGQQLAAYRILQEALTNALRHGDRSAEVVVGLDWTPDALALVVGNAMPPVAPSSLAAGPPTAGHGLAGMRERALLAGGSFSAGSADGTFVVTAMLPRPAGIRSGDLVPGGVAGLPVSDRRSVA